ncbi:restriction endonuclease subunit S [Escherichia coli]|nr:restriction endonuclease subunit S [Escherichia coli]
MSELSYLEKLLDGVEVEWRNLGDTSLFEIANNGRKPVKASLRIAGETPYYGANNIQDYVDGYTHDGEYVLIAEDGSASLENYSIQYATGKFWANNHVHVVRGKERVHSRFLYHYLCIVNFLPFLTGGGRAKLTKGQLIEIPVPIPCPGNPEKSLAIQSEIVRILDKFTALTAELTAELNMRKKQYNYYRDQLLRFKEGEVEWKSLEDIALFRRGSFPQPYGNSEWYDGEGCMPFVQVADVADSGFTLHTKTKQQISKIAQSKSVFVEAGTIVVTLQGTIGRVAITQYDCYVDRTLAIFTNFKVKINKKYFAYQLKAKFDSEKEFARGSTLKTITKEEFSKFQLPLPSINEQNRIVSLLDKFDTLAHSIKQGLPREIELRQKQYEYYRDLLFSFPKPETASN